MKKIFATLMMSALLASCASDKGPVDENKFKTTKQPVKKTEEKNAIGLAPLKPTKAEDCVTLEGKFKKADTANKEGPSIVNFDEMNLATKRETGKVSYSYNSQFIVADGQEREENGVKAKAVCDKSSFEITATKNGKADVVRFTLENEKAVKVLGSGDFAILNGSYAKQEAIPAPVTCPEGQVLKDGACVPAESPAPAGDDTL